MKKQNPLIKGTLILTGAGFLTRIIGFFNRIYLSQLIGAKEMGIYQLVFPVYMIAFAFSCHGIEFALSQMIAADKGNRRLVSSASAISLISSLLFSTVIYLYAEPISYYLLKEKNCAICLKLMAPVLPFTAVRCSIHGYYIGKKDTFVPAAGQLIEQLVRVFVIWLIAESYGQSRSFTASLAVCGMVIGEIAGTIYTYLSYKIQIGIIHNKNNDLTFDRPKKSTLHLPYGKELLKRAIPLTANKLSLTLMSAFESVLIPFMLTIYYNNQELSLSMYGILTGMALPFIMFPSTLTNSLSVMLLPTVSEANASGNQHQLRYTIKKTVKLCLTLGFTVLIFFFFLGRQIGSFIFHNESAGDFLVILSFLCPFLYLSGSGNSILNGLGFMKETFLYNLTAIIIRILFILLMVPMMGIQGYLIGLLAAYLVLVLLQGYKIRRSIF